jgi:hypothetical protein
MPRRRAFVGLAAIAAAALHCSSSKLDAFYARVHTCDSRAPDPDCGTTRAGAPLMCSRVTQTLGGNDICTEACADGPGASTDTYACLQDGSMAPRCRPSGGAAACADPALGCLRTDLERDEGLCLPVRTCSDDSTCPAQRSTCMTTLAGLLYPNAKAKLHLDSLHCMTVGCQAAMTSCQSGEQCVRNVVSNENDVPDVCLPTCDGQKRCPPNHTCLRRLSPAYPDICVPGVLGRPCDTDLDCLIGECTSLEHGYNVCTRPCATDSDCTPFDSGPTFFFCTQGRCVSPESLTWPDCYTDDDCHDPGLVCAYPDPTQKLGACRVPCPADGSKCPARAGIVHGCFTWSGKAVCQPGLFARYPCTSDDDCSPGLHCLGPGSNETCTLPCAADADCDRDRQTAGGFCLAGLCALAQAEGATCTRARECASGMCDAGTGTCQGPGSSR